MLQAKLDNIRALAEPSVPEAACAVDPVATTTRDNEVFADLLLAALVLMAARSKRRQADLSAVLRRAKLPADLEQVGPALALLEETGLIQDIVPLYDGGMLISITSQGMDRPRRGDNWAFLERRSPLS